MTDIFTSQKRSDIMSKVRSSKTKPELLLKEALKGLRLRYQPGGYGKPDFASKKLKIAIFVDGSFWHGRPGYGLPSSNKEFWRKKIKINKKRDLKVNKTLRNKGWTVMRFWDYEVKNNPLSIRKLIKRKMVAKG